MMMRKYTLSFFMEMNKMCALLFCNDKKCRVVFFCDDEKFRPKFTLSIISHFSQIYIFYKFTLFLKSLLNFIKFFAIFLNTLFCYILTLLSSSKNHLIILTQLVFSDNASQDFHIFFLYGCVVSHRVYSIKPLKWLVFSAKFKA